MSTEGQLTPGELDVIRINKERQAAMDRGEITNDKRHLLRGMAALNHIQKVNSAKGVETPSHVQEEHKQAHVEDQRESGGQEKTPGEIALEEENARRQEQIDLGEADYRRLLHGAAADAWIHHYNEQHGVHGKAVHAPRKHPQQSHVLEDKPLEEIPAQFGGKKLFGAAAAQHEQKLARQRGEQKGGMQE